MATIIDGDFEWDADKAARNLEKHGVSFEEAVGALADPLAIYQDDGSGTERMVGIGVSPRRRLLCVAYEARGLRDRIISAREATRSERALYENG